MHAHEARGLTGLRADGSSLATQATLHRVVGVLATNLHVLADERSREAIAIDTALPCVDWLTAALRERGWTLKLIVSTHGHWDHIGDNAPVSEATGAQIAVHPADAYRLANPTSSWLPLEILPSVPAVELAEGGEVRFGAFRLEVLHTPGHTEGSVCLFDREAGRLYSGDTLFKGSFGRVDLPGGDPEAMIESLDRLRTFDDFVTVLPGHGPSTTIGAERPWLDWIARERQLPGG